MPPPGLLFVFGEAGPNVTEEKFNDWYDSEHVPLCMAIPTFRRTIRWIAADGERPQYLAKNDGDSCDVFDTPPYNTTRSEREKDVISSSIAVPTTSSGPTSSLRLRGTTSGSRGRTLLRCRRASCLSSRTI